MNANHVTGKRVSRTQAQGLEDMRLGFLRPADPNLGQAHVGVRPREVRIEGQSALVFLDAAGGPAGGAKHGSP